MTNKENAFVSFAVPVYNNHGTLHTLHETLVAEFTSNFPNWTYEIVFVNDNSKDSSLEDLLDIRKKDPNVRIVDFTKNFGQQYGILAGWANSKGDCTIDMAADLQDPVEQTTKMLKQWDAGSKVVISYREVNGTSLRKRITSKLFYKLILPQVPSGGFDFTLLDRKAREIIVNFKDKNRFYQHDIISIGYAPTYIPYDKQVRTIGESGFTFMKRIKVTTQVYLNVGYGPLRAMIVLGFVVFSIGALYTANVFYAYFANAVPFKGWTPIMMLLTMGIGVIMLFLGIIGEYIWRLYDEIKGRPNYIIKDIYE